MHDESLFFTVVTMVCALLVADDRQQLGVRRGVIQDNYYCGNFALLSPARSYSLCSLVA